MQGTSERLRRALGAMALVCVLGASAPARAQLPLPIPGDWATEHTQWLNHLQLILQLKKMIEQIDYLKRQLWTQIDMFDNMMQHTWTVRDFEWGSVKEELRRLHEIFAESRALAYTMKDLEKEFRDRYKDYAEYSRERWRTPDLVEKYEQWSDESIDVIKSTLRAAGMQAEQFEDEEEVLTNLRWQSETSEGRMQALQVGHQIALQEVHQLQKLRQLLMLQIQMHTDAAAVQTEKEAMQRGQFRGWTQTIERPRRRGRDLVRARPER